MSTSRATPPPKRPRAPPPPRGDPSASAPPAKRPRTATATAQAQVDAELDAIRRSIAREKAVPADQKRRVQAMARSMHGANDLRELVRLASRVRAAYNDWSAFMRLSVANAEPAARTHESMVQLAEAHIKADRHVPLPQAADMIHLAGVSMSGTMLSDAASVAHHAVQWLDRTHMLSKAARAYGMPQIVDALSEYLKDHARIDGTITSRMARPCMVRFSSTSHIVCSVRASVLLSLATAYVTTKRMQLQGTPSAALSTALDHIKVHGMVVVYDPCKVQTLCTFHNLHVSSHMGAMHTHAPDVFEFVARLPHAWAHKLCISLPLDVASFVKFFEANMQPLPFPVQMWPALQSQAKRRARGEAAKTADDTSIRETQQQVWKFCLNATFLQKRRDAAREDNAAIQSASTCVDKLAKERVLLMKRIAARQRSAPVPPLPPTLRNHVVHGMAVRATETAGGKDERAVVEKEDITLYADQAGINPFVVTTTCDDRPRPPFVRAAAEIVAISTEEVKVLRAEDAMAADLDGPVPSPAPAATTADASASASASAQPANTPSS